MRLAAAILRQRQQKLNKKVKGAADRAISEENRGALLFAWVMSVHSYLCKKENRRKDLYEVSDKT